MRTAQHKLRTTRCTGILAATATTVLLAAGCAGSDASPGSSSDGRGSSQQQNAQDPGGDANDATNGDPGGSAGSDDESCGTAGAEEAAQYAADQLPPAFGDPGQADIAWDAAGAELDGYDPCASLAWIVLPIQGGTGSSPYAIALFHEGEYVGPATEKSYGFDPDTSRVDDATIAVTYKYPQADDSNADPSGAAHAQFQYDEASQSVLMTGEVPPV